ncbi:MAG: hypothetical protein WBS24_03455 [Terriglobales bacterium]
MAESKRFRHKPTEVDAIEGVKILQAAANGTGDKLPRWVQDALFEKRLEIWPHRYAVVAYPLPGVPRLGAARDWILFDATDKTVNIIPPETLRDLYDAID